MRALALLSAHNEERFITACLGHLVAQGLEVLLLDDGSTDRTVAKAEFFLGKGLVEIRRLARGPHFEWESILRHKEQIAHQFDADWFLHVDADDFRMPWSRGLTLLDCLTQADLEGYNAVDSMEFTFLPTRESPGHDHPRFLETMRWYHPYLPFSPHRLNAWKKQKQPVELAWSGGHIVRFPGLRVHPRRLPLKHYLYLSAGHAAEKYVQRCYHPGEVAYGWHEWRAHVTPEDIALPASRELRELAPGAALDPSSPRKTYFIEDRINARRARAVVA